jgi:hypothetical protein
MIHAFMLLGGLALLGWNTWQRMGRSPAARSWVNDGSGDFAERRTLALWPLLGLALLLAAGLGPARDSTTAAVAIGLPFALVMLLWLAYLMLPIPVPSWALPPWYRQLGARRSGRGARG